MFSSSIPVKELVKRTPPQTSRGLGGSSNKGHDVSTESLKKTPQNQNNNKAQGNKTDSQGKKRSKKGKNKQKKVTEDSPEKADDSQMSADEILMKEMLISSSESEIEEKRVQENQLKRGMSSDSEEENHIKKAKNESQQQQQKEVEMASLSDAQGSNRDGGSDEEHEAEQGEGRSGKNKIEEDGDGADFESFLYIKGKDFDITQVSALRAVQQIGEALQRNKPSVIRINRCLRVRCLSHEEKEKVKEIRYLVGHAVDITEAFSRTNRAPQTNRGIIFGIEDDVTDEEISTEIGIKAERIFKRRGDIKIPTSQILLHVEGPLPEFVRLGWRRHRVSTYIPPPTRCYKCQRFGHIAANCGAKKEKCPICSGPHPYAECQVKDTHRTDKTASCPNCKGPHPASYQGCPAYQQAKVCKKIQTNEGISYAAAVKKHRAGQLEAGSKNEADRATQINQTQPSTQPTKIKPKEKETETQTEAPSAEVNVNNTRILQQVENLCSFIQDFFSKFLTTFTERSSKDDSDNNFRKLLETLQDGMNTIKDQIHSAIQPPQINIIHHG